MAAWRCLASIACLDRILSHNKHRQTKKLLRHRKRRVSAVGWTAGTALIHPISNCGTTIQHPTNWKHGLSTLDTRPIQEDKAVAGRNPVELRLLVVRRESYNTGSPRVRLVSPFTRIYNSWANFRISTCVAAAGYRATVPTPPPKFSPTCDVVGRFPNQQVVLALPKRIFQILDPLANVEFKRLVPNWPILRRFACQRPEACSGKTS